MRYVVLAVASDAEADRLVQDLTENPSEPLRTPRWGNAVHARLTAMPYPRLSDTVYAAQIADITQGDQRLRAGAPRPQDL